MTQKFAGAVLLDFGATKDVLDQDIVNWKAQMLWFRQSVTSWVQKAFYNGSVLNCCSLVCGIPQVRFLGTLLFRIVIIDLPSAVKNTGISMYADDSTVYHVEHSTWLGQNK